MIIQRILRFTSAAAVLFCAGCAVGPDYQAPAESMPAKWVYEEKPSSAPAASRIVAAPADLSNWWTSFKDPLLASLMERAFQGNLDLRLALQRIQQARAACGVAGATLWPQLNAEASYERSRSIVATKGGQSAQYGSFFRDGFDASWEIDLFGGIRRGVEAAESDLASSVEDLHAASVTLASELALDYCTLRGAQQQLQIAKRNLASQVESADLTRRRFDAGFVSYLDVANAESLVAATEAAIPTFETVVRQQCFGIAALLGEQPGALLAELEPDAPQVTLPAEVPIGVPAELLHRRPDVRRAESDVHAAVARVGVAEAQLYPKLTLSGFIGIQSNTLRGAVDTTNHIWSFGPSLLIPLFAGGRLRADIAVQEALAEQSFTSYKKTVVAAAQEVEDALIAYSKEQQRREALRRSAAAGREAVALAEQLYGAGKTDFLNVLTAERSLFLAEDAEAQSDRQLAANLIALYKALGGGWPAPRQAAPQG